MNRVKITDTTFRDGHQSLLATRLRTADMTPIAPQMDSIGFHSLEVWGGATFDSTTRFLGEDPWERLRTFKKLMPKTALQMLLRGQSLVGYRAYADDVVEAFVQRSAEAGIDVFRVFDALNDIRNLEAAAKAVKKSGKHLQMTICYSVTEEGRMGGPIYNLDYFVGKAKLFASYGADSICLKDMAGLLAPYDAYQIISAFKKVLKVPVHLHTHYTSGMASMTVLKAIEAGVDVVDTALAPLALRTAQPAVEPLLVTLKGEERDPGLDLEKLLDLGDHLETVLPKYKQYFEANKVAVIDARVLSHQIPGGMASNLTSQLKEAGALEKLPEVLKDIAITRKELGYPPLVTPMSQMVGSQAVSNVLFGRYKMVSGQVKDYVYGLYGQPPSPIDPAIVKTALVGYERGQKPITTSPADLLEPELAKAIEMVKPISTDLDDVLTYALYPTTGMKFLRIKHGLEPMPDDMKGPLPAKPASPASAPATSPSKTPHEADSSSAKSGQSQAHARSTRSRKFNVYVGADLFQVEVDPVGGPVIAGPVAAPPSTPAAEPAQANGAQSAAPGPNDITVIAPMPGLVLRYPVTVGQKVNAGETVVVLEAMKMENSLPAPRAGTVKALPVKPGTKVSRGDILAIVSP
ncbi:MAG: pyruvate carboxylase subunit B [SAR202 cluster bacterium]|nr:pyruvate carboxylase subunit B [SAR202 cluster bacterium]